MLTELLMATMLHTGGIGPVTERLLLPQALAGQSAGISHGSLIVAGGSSFAKPPWDGGIKQWSRAVFVLPPGGSWQHFELDTPLGYGCAVSWRDQLIIAGGSNGKENFSRVFSLEFKDGRIRQQDFQPLPVTLANCSAALIQNTMYVFGGQTAPDSPSTSSTLFGLNLANPEKPWTRIEANSPEGRILPVLSAHENTLYLFSGAALTPARRYLYDAWSYRPDQGWKRLPDTPEPVVAAPSVTSGHSIFILGGDNGTLASRISELKDRHPGFSKLIRVFNTQTGTWSTAGTLPLSLVTTNACNDTHTVYVPGGEDRPGHRSNRVLLWPLLP